MVALQLFGSHISVVPTLPASVKKIKTMTKVDGLVAAPSTLPIFLSFSGDLESNTEHEKKLEDHRGKNEELSFPEGQ